MRRLRIFLIIPALDEEENLAKVLEALAALSLSLEKIIVVDNGSTDATAEVARRGGAWVLEENQRGYGAACLRGIDYLRSSLDSSSEDNVLVFLDADYSDYPEDLPNILAPIERGEVDFVVGSRLSSEQARKAVPGVSRVGNTFAMTVLRWLYGVRFTDMGPFRAITWDALQSLGMKDRTWGWTLEMQLKAAALGIRCAEVPVRYRNRFSGESKISRSLVGAVRAASKILWVLGGHLCGRLLGVGKRASG